MSKADMVANLMFDMLNSFMIPTNTMQSLFQQHMNKKAEKLRDIIISEIDSGNFSRINEDDRVSLFFRLTQAAMNGSARSNLRLLAQIINSRAKDENINPELFPSEFNRYASIIETLSLDEIKMLSVLLIAKEDVKGAFTVNVFENAKLQYNKAKEVVSKKKVISDDMVELCCSALQRTGLVMKHSATFGGAVYSTTEIFDEIIKLADFQDCLKKEGVSI